MPDGFLQKRYDEQLYLGIVYIISSLSKKRDVEMSSKSVELYIFKNHMNLKLLSNDETLNRSTHKLLRRKGLLDFGVHETNC